MSRLQLVLISLCMLSLMATGCRNCAWNPCYNACGGGGFAGQPTTIAPPSTYSMNIPSVTQNQPYYNRVPTTARANGILNPNNRAPTPATNSPTLAPSSGWRSVGGNNYSLNPNQYQNNSSTNGQSQSVLASVVEPASQPARSLNRTASTTNNVVNNNGGSFRDSVDYRSTGIDERRDPTRLPATDASTVRAPVNTTGLTQAAYNVPAQTYNVPVQVGQNQIVSQPIYNGTYQTTAVPVVGTYNAVPQVYGVPTYAANPAPVYNGAAPTVLAQSTAVYDPRSSQGSGGWRDRELLGSGSFNR